MILNPRLSGEEWNAISYAVDEMEKILYPPEEKLNKICRELGIYQDSRYPGMCWILDEVLGLNPREVCLDGFDLSAGFYQTFVLTKEGSPQVGTDGFPRTQTHQLTAEQRDLLEEWWDYVPEELKYGYR